MKKQAIFVLLLFPFAICYTQQPQRTAPPDQQKQEYPARMTPQMTEFFDHHVAPFHNRLNRDTAGSLYFHQKLLGFLDFIFQFQLTM